MSETGSAPAPPAQPEGAAMISLLGQLLAAGRPAEALDRLAARFIEERDYERLFEVRKLQQRLAAGVPPVYRQRPAGLAPEQERALEQGLAASALECGRLMAETGDVAGAWSYLRAVEDAEAVRSALEAVPVDDSNAHALIQICVNEQAHPAYGMNLALERIGTCSSITLLEGISPQLPTADRQATSGVLVRHLAGEIVNTATGRLGLPSGLTLDRLLGEYSPALSRSGPHVDPSHLMSVLRLGRTVEDRPTLADLLSLARYAGLLPEGVRYPGDIPFQNVERDHGLWYSALLGSDSASAEAHFCQQLDRYADPAQRLVALEYGVLLLGRLGRFREAARLALEDGPDLSGLTYGAAGIAPHPVELALFPDAAPVVASWYERREDPLGYLLTSIVQMKTSAAGQVCPLTPSRSGTLP
jgi:hypothetical protein